MSAIQIVPVTTHAVSCLIAEGCFLDAAVVAEMLYLSQACRYRFRTERLQAEIATDATVHRSGG